MKSEVRRWSRILILLFVPVYICSAQQNGQDSTKYPIQKIGESLYQIGNVRLNSEARELIIPGKVNMDSGLIELVACTAYGKVHESMLVLDVVPYHIQVALLLLGLEYGSNIAYQGDPRTPAGDSVEVWVSWFNGKDTVRHRAEDLVFDVLHKKLMPHSPWIFSGSRFVNNIFMADMEGSLITTYHDPFTILDNPQPEGGNDELYVVNREIVPPKKTKIKVIIKALSQSGTK